MTAILLALLSGFYLQNFHPGYAALIVSAVGAYALIEFGARGWSEGARNLTRYALVTFVVFLTVIGPSALEIYLRHASAPYDHIHDGALQAETAMKFFLAGQTPFGLDYSRTIVGLWPHYVMDPQSIPNLYHYVYLPITFIAPVPIYVAMQTWLGWFDVRVVWIIAFVILWFVLPMFTRSWDGKLSLLITFGLNPTFVPFFVEGRNDILVLMWLALSWVALQRGRVGWSTAMLALACATKATAWLIVPFYFAHLWWTTSEREAFLRGALVFAAVFVAIMLPFSLWDFRALVEDILVMPSVTNYVWGYGFSMFLLAAGIIPDRGANFPFWILQLIFGLSAMFFLLRYQSRERTIRALVISAAVFTFVIFFFGRNFADNYVGYDVSLGLIAFFMPHDDRTT